MSTTLGNVLEPNRREGVPTMFIAELGHSEFKRFDLTSLRTGIMAGSPCPIEVMRRCVDVMNVSEVTIAYGMTETSPPMTVTGKVQKFIMRERMTEEQRSYDGLVAAAADQIQVVLSLLTYA